MSSIHEALGVDAAKEVVSFSSPSAKEPSELGGVEEFAGHHSSHLLPLVARKGGGNSEVAPACILRSGAIATGLVVNMASCFFKNSQAILGHSGVHESWSGWNITAAGVGVRKAEITEKEEKEGGKEQK
ncbi:hypothetical protein ACLOJK_012199 [Asimina triloba]